MAVTSDIIFRMGVVGAASAKKDMLVAAAAVAAVGYALKKVRDEASEFSQVWANLSYEQIKGAQAMDEATKGLADTMVTFKTAVKLTEAKLRPTPELMAAIGKVAVDVGQKLGETPQGLQTRIDKLTDAIARGQSRALKGYGLDLENTEDLLLAQAEAVDKIMERAEEIEVHYQTLGEKLFAVKNNLETTIGLEYDALTATDLLGGALDPLLNKWGRWNNLIMDTDGLILNAETSMTIFAQATKLYAFEIAQATSELFGLNAGLGEQIRKQKIIIGLEAEILKAKGKQRIEARDVARPAAPEALATTKSKARGGGRRRVESAEEMTISEGDVLSADLASGAYFGPAGYDPLAQIDILAAIRQGVLNLHGSINDGLFPGDILTDDTADLDRIVANIAAIDEAQTMLAERNEDRWAREYEHDEVSRIMEEEHTYWMEDQYAIREGVLVSHQARMLGIEQEGVNASNRMWQSGVQGRLQLMGGFFDSLSLLQTVRSKKLFIIGKAGAIAEAGVNTALGMIKAFQAMAGIPIVGPALGGIAAGAVATAGAASIARIKEQTYEGGGSSSKVGVPSVAEGGAGDYFGSNSYGGGGGNSGGTQTINLILDGEQIHKVILNQNDNQSQQGNRSFATG